MALLTALGAPLLFHIAPSPTQNNRYAKLVLRHDAVRIAYTIYFGERPGAEERRRMDTDRDGVVDDGEQMEFARQVAAQIAPLVKVELDGKAPAAGWSVADVGLGTPSAAGGAFSVDLALEAPLSGAGEHSVWLDDGWPIPSPGETEVRVEAAPGVVLLESHPERGAKGILAHATWQGTARTTMWVRYRVTDDPAPEAAPPRAKGWPLWLAAIGVGLGLGVGLGARWRRRRPGRPSGR